MRKSINWEDGLGFAVIFLVCYAIGLGIIEAFITGIILGAAIRYLEAHRNR